MEAVQKCGPNVVGFQMDIGRRRWYIIRCYLAPDNTSTIESVVVALKERPGAPNCWWRETSTQNLSEPEGDQRGEEITARLASEGLEDILAHFPPRRRSWFRDRRPWSMVRDGREAKYRTDYILCTDRRIFWNVSVWDRWHNSDHYRVPGCLCIAPLREHSKNLGRRKRLPLLTYLHAL